MASTRNAPACVEVARVDAAPACSRRIDRLMARVRVMRHRRWLGPVLLVGLFIAAVGGRRLLESDRLPPPLLDAPFPGTVRARFVDGAGHERALADFTGRLVLVNVWATWCPPCRDELPSLDALEEALGGARFAVVPISVDAGGVQAARRFYDRVGVRALEVYAGREDDVLRSLGVVALPTTILVDERGAEIGRMVGPAAWGGERGRALVERELRAPRGAPDAGSR